MLDIVLGYQNLLHNIDSYIDESKFKKEYLIEKLQVSRATFYNKAKNKSFTVAEMVTLIKILFPEEARAFEIKQALLESREDSRNGRLKTHAEVMANVRKKLNK
ncbi:hypothetical protein [Sediminicola luteus]|uniref:HTH cro/C1-type domain-containing protein n=1 Tax=Sediminicola luteus TaxID=319238 RepID=A0A2A4G352_9FLAO|nr:hypothetical protein [Sediminicola luteus]PCE62853.1 hypothetical protein B7P33_16365 [Sediminicola luteus]